MKIQKTAALILATLLTALLLTACTEQRTSGKGLVLPEGNIEDGKATFVNLGCIYCHSIPNVDLDMPEEEFEPLLLLGGKVQKVKTYGELVTSIVNPQHVISPAYLEKLKAREAGVEVNSIMPTFNDDMTVSQLIDLITFLDSSYEKLLPQYVSMRHGYGAY